MPSDPRTVSQIRGEIAEVRRHLHEAPPHHGGGRAVLQARLDALQAELRDAERSNGRDRRGGARGPGAASGPTPAP